MSRTETDRVPAPAGPGVGHLVGRVLDDRFVLRSVLGVGGMGTVYRAEQFSMNREVAVKVLRGDLAHDDGAVRRFLTEARAASRLKSPHTVTVFDFGRTPDGILYIAMELLDGRTLADVLAEEGHPFALIRATRLLNQVLDSMDEAHSVGILHRDLKPDNVFRLEGAGSRDFVKVLDFGVAKMLFDPRPGQTIAGLSFGTPVYMSPEQMMGRDVGPPADLYAVAIMLVELLSGRAPIEEQSPVEMALRKMEGHLPLPRQLRADAECTDAVDAFLEKALAPAPEARFQDAESFRVALNQAVRDSTSGPRPDPAWRATPLPGDAIDVQAATRLSPALSGGVRMPGAVPPADEPPWQDGSDGPARAERAWVRDTVPGPRMADAWDAPAPGDDEAGRTVDLLAPEVGDAALGRHGTVLGVPVADLAGGHAPAPAPRPAPDAASQDEEADEAARADRRRLAAKAAAAGERRSRPRVPHLTTVTCVHGGARHRALVADVSEAGAFVNSAWLPLAGHEVALVFRTTAEGDGPGVVVRCRVVRVVDVPQAAGEVRGFSVRWMTLRTQGRLGRLLHFYRSLFGADLPTDRPPESRAALWEWSFDDRRLKSRGDQESE